MAKTKIAQLSDLKDREPAGAIVANVDLVIVKYDDAVSVLYGRCLHRGALLEDGYVEGDTLFCGVHKWDFQLNSGVSAYDNSEALHKFSSWVQGDDVLVDEDEIAAWEKNNPQPYNRASYLGRYADPSGGADEEPDTDLIKQLATQGLEKIGKHGPMTSMGVALPDLPQWNDIQFVTAQLAKAPLLGEQTVTTKTIIGPKAKKPVTLDIPIFISDMSFGSLSASAKLALAIGAEMSGTAICSGEGGMLPEEQEACSKYFYELGSGKFGYSLDKVTKAQAFHFKGGQAAKTGIGGHLPGHKIDEKIAKVREIEPGEDAISPSRFPDMTTTEDFKKMAQRIRSATGGIPIGFKLSAQHIENDIDAAVAIGVDYIILDGRGGGTGAAPQIFRDNISVPTIPALARAASLR
jgi:glutamate synthase domain-containing protein 2